MAKKKFQDQAAKKNEGTKMKNDELIVLNNGVSEVKTVEDEIEEIISSLEDSDEETQEEDEEETYVVDTDSLSDIIGDTLKELMGNMDFDEEEEQTKRKKKKKSKEKHKVEKGENKKDEEEAIVNEEAETEKESQEDDIQEIVDRFIMILKGKEVEKINSPFQKNSKEYLNLLDECLEKCPHLAIVKYIRNNPTSSVNNAFDSLFIFEDKEMIDDNYEPEVIEDTDKPVDNTEDNKPERNDFKLYLCTEILELQRYLAKEFGIIEKLVDEDDEDKIDLEINKIGKKLEKNNITKIFEIEGIDISEMIKQMKNQDTTLFSEFMEILYGQEDFIERMVSKVPKSMINEDPEKILDHIYNEYISSKYIAEYDEVDKFTKYDNVFKRMNNSIHKKNA